MESLNTHRNWNNRNKLRHRLKIRLFELNKDLFEQIPEKWYGEHRSEAGKKIVELARKNIGFSPKYCDEDLFRSLVVTYREINHPEKIEN